MASTPLNALQRIKSIALSLRDRQQILRLARQVSKHVPHQARCKPVVFFNASTRLSRLSLNAAFSMLASWGLRLSGVPVVHFVCRSGMSRCPQGTDRLDYDHRMPCAACIRLSRAVYSAAEVRGFDYQRDHALAAVLQGLTLDQLMTFIYPFRFGSTFAPRGKPSPVRRCPLGAFVLPSIRWVLRRHHLQDDEPTRALYREYILSAWNVVRHFNALLDEIQPEVAVIFNGQFFPESAARWVASKRSVRVITHEVGIQPFSGFFTDGEATAYPIRLPDGFDLTPQQNSNLDGYLEKRFQGKFSMAGISFWPEMRGLDEAFLSRASGFKQVVPVFTNVIFDTSQPHSNVVFPNMLAWLDLILGVIRAHPETLFVIRAHPDEGRPGKESQESVAMWVSKRRVLDLPNVMFVDTNQYISSYELIRHSKFVMIYNSTIGLEASIMGAAVLCGGRARFTQYPTVFFPKSRALYRRQAESFLSARRIKVPPEFKRNARRFLYYQLFRTSLPFGDFLEPGALPGFVQMKKFSVHQLAASPAIKVIVEGILSGSDFVLAG